MTAGTKVMSYSTVMSTTNPGIAIEGGTSRFPLTSTIGVLRFLKDTVINKNYKLQADLTAEVKTENDKYVVFDYQVNEYGIGNSLEEARQDLLDSLIDYLESLEKRENRLATKEHQNLQLLKKILLKT
jgi:hypothetical protein